MDSFVLFNDEGCPATDDKPLALKQETHIIEQSIVQNLQTMQSNDETVLGDKPYEKQET